MTSLTLVLRNLTRHRARLAFTAIAVTFAIVTLLLLRTTLWSLTANTSEGPQDRLATWNEVSYAQPLPARHAQAIRAIDGIDAVTFATWFGGKHPARPDEQLTVLAIDPESYFDVYTDMEVPAEQLESWRADRQGVILGEGIASHLGLGIGDTLTLEGTVFPGAWTFRVQGLYASTSNAVDRSQILIRWDYLNDAADETQREQVGWLMSRVDPRRGTELATAIDEQFAAGIRTLTMSERGMQQYSLGNFAAVMSALGVISIILLLIIMLVLGNALAMIIRERVREYGVFAALGFSRRHVVLMILGEAAVLGALGGLLGSLGGYLLIDQGIGPAVEESMGSLFPRFRIPLALHLTSAGVAIASAVAAGLVPALSISKIPAREALRRTT
ncbi:MAG: FtsX-like permease family protein [Myxococcota bacterium]